MMVLGEPKRLAQEGDEKALLEHADKIESGQVAWRRGNPTNPGTACIGYEHSATLGYWRCVWRSRVGHEALCLEAKKRGALDFVSWNDLDCHDATEAVDFLRHAAKRVWEVEG